MITSIRHHLLATCESFAGRYLAGTSRSRLLHKYHKTLIRLLAPYSRVTPRSLLLLYAMARAWLISLLKPRKLRALIALLQVQQMAVRHHPHPEIANAHIHRTLEALGRTLTGLR